MTQSELVLHYLKFHMEIIPAKMTGKVYEGTMFGSEISRVCRSLRKQGRLVSYRQGKFEVFALRDARTAPENSAEAFLRDWPSKPKEEDKTNKLF